jgi:hypothetical protein
MTSEMVPDDLAAEPSKTTLRSSHWRKWMMIGGIITLIVVVVGIRPAKTMGSPKSGTLSQAVNNAKEIGCSLLDFEQDYGSFPCAATVPEVQSKNPDSNIPLGKSSSNDFFRQLIVSNIRSEKPFYAKSWDNPKPDNVMKGAKALEKGETPFSYIAGLSSSKDPPETPIVVFPLIAGKYLFDYKLCQKFYRGQAIVLFLDNTVDLFPVDKSGRVFIGGKDIFDPSQPFWHGKAPDVKWPE